MHSLLTDINDLITFQKKNKRNIGTTFNLLKQLSEIYNQNLI